MQAAVAGNREAFDVLVGRHQRSVFRLCYRFVGRQEEADDLTQEVFLRAYRHLGRFRGRAAFATWLYRIAINTCLNRVARRQPAAVPLDGVTLRAAPSAAPDRPLERRELRVPVQAAVRTLPARQRAVLILRIYHDLRHDEIARIVGTSVGAVKANFFHALRNLRQRLDARPRS